MRRFCAILLMISLLLFSSCVRKSSRDRTRERGTVSYPSESRRQGSTRAERAIHSATHDRSLPSKVQRLADQIERKFKADTYTAEDLANWTSLYLEYSMAYSLSSQNLSDEQCESIEFNLGKIAGVIYKEGVIPVMDEIDEIEKGIEDYEERSKKWAGAAERGFRSAAGDIDSE